MCFLSQTKVMFSTVGESSVPPPPAARISLFALPTRKHTAETFKFNCMF